MDIETKFQFDRLLLLLNFLTQLMYNFCDIFSIHIYIYIDIIGFFEIENIFLHYTHREYIAVFFIHYFFQTGKPV